MAIIVPSWRYGGAPTNADASWSQSCGFWRKTAVCPVGISVGPTISLRRAFDGGWLASKIGHNCAGTDSYFSNMTGLAVIDLWGALRDGVWSSSVVFNIYVHREFSFNPSSATITARPNMTAPYNPAEQTKAVTGLIVRGAVCSSDLVATLTAYDDGTFTLA